MDKYIFVFLLTSMVSCNDINENEIIGNWELNFFNVLPIKYDQLYIRKNEIVLIDEFLFPERGSYELENNILNAYIQNKSNVKIKIEELTNDTMIISGNSYIRKNQNVLINQIEYYEIAGISTGKKLDADSNFRLIHFYKSAEGATKIRCSSKVVEAKEIQSYLYRSYRNHTSNEKNRIKLFLGKNISLKDLKEIYMYFYSYGMRNIVLVVNKNEDNEFEIFNDKIDFWKKDIEQFSEELNLPAPSLPDGQYNSKEEFLKNSTSKNVKINTSEDIRKLNNLSKELLYLVSISDTMSIKSYIEIKKILFDARKSYSLSWITEISSDS